MAFDAKVILDSIPWNSDHRLLTIQATYPRFIHAEIMTHRDRERNAASSRAIPWIGWRNATPEETPDQIDAFGQGKMLSDKCMKGMILKDPVVPLTFGAEQRGMQQGGLIPPQYADLAKSLWLAGRDVMVEIADMFHNIGDTYQRLCDGDLQLASTLLSLGVNMEEIDPRLSTDPELRIHKSLANRLTEPWMWITVVMTATEWNNFFRLRCHPAAEQHFFKVACMIRDAIKASTPQILQPGEWHLPYVRVEEFADIDKHWADNYVHHGFTATELAKRVSTARCARVSYLTQDGKRDFDADLKLYERLLHPMDHPEDTAFHASPFGHVAMPSADPEHRSGPFIGWVQHRKEFKNENVAGCL